MLQGLWKSGADLPPTLKGMSNRIYMKATLDSLRVLFYISCIMQEIFDTVTFIPTRMAHAMYEARYT